MTLETSIRGKQLVPLASSSLRIEGPLKAGKQGFHRCHRSKRKTTVKASPATVSAFEAAAAKASPLNYVRVWCQHIRFVHGYYCVYLLARLWIQYSVCELKFGWWFWSNVYTRDHWKIIGKLIKKGWMVNHSPNVGTTHIKRLWSMPNLQRRRIRTIFSFCC